MSYTFISFFGGDKGNDGVERKIMEYGYSRNAQVIGSMLEEFCESPERA